MKILISTPLLQSDIGGPASYAFHLEKYLKQKGHQVTIVSFAFEKKIPSGFRHLFYFFRVFARALSTDHVITLDASSVGFPTILACRITGTASTVRLGGDFLWERYVERTGSEITLDSFYKKLPALSLKEKWIYITTSFVLRNVSHLVVNTEWLSKILSDGYVYDTKKTTCIENYFAGVQMCPETMQHTYVAASRAIKLKNKDRLKKVRNAMKHPPISLIDTSMSQNDLHEIVTQCHATAVVSFSEVSPNLVLEGVARGKPFIVTKHTGLHPRFASMGFFVDPFDEDSIRQGFHALSDESQYKRYLAAIEDCTYIHTWDVIGSKFEKLLI